MDTIRLYGLAAESIVDGKGYRAVIFTQGCPHRCEGCHNPESHDPNGGTVWTINDVAERFLHNPLLEGITLSGGEPFAQPAACAELARRAHARGLTVWTYSGYTLEQLFQLAKSSADIHALLSETDVLIDGPFLLAERSLSLRYRGSKNQRLIDMHKTRAQGEVVLWEAENWL